jgi:hypothetical protein
MCAINSAVPSRDWTHFLNPTQDWRPGLLSAIPSGLLRAPGEVSSLTADAPR